MITLAVRMDEARERSLLGTCSRNRMHRTAVRLRFDHDNAVGQAALDTVTFDACVSHGLGSGRVFADEAATGCDHARSELFVLRRQNGVEAVGEHGYSFSRRRVLHGIVGSGREVQVGVP